ncbi:unnamed protein product [Euphydryas editha]|uniref:FP protein C-terminal domain-containing protein n=1 Tax=Euphydryas editha TaxID=104508 RepID=A0AAU9V7L3_EUPED|nr:unnamed protein product [Euphydryas editha]
MNSNCSGCGNPIMDLYYMECSRCKDRFDLLCINIPKDSFDRFSQSYKDDWLCPSCVCALPKGDNTSTPVRTPKSSSHLNDKNICSNVNPKRGSRPLCAKTKNVKYDSPPNPDLETLISELRLLREELAEVKEQNRDIKNQMSTLSDNISRTVQEHSDKIRNAEREIITLKASVGLLQQQLASRDQDNLRNDLEIVGIAEQNSENLQQIVLDASQKLGIPLSESDIDDVFRVGLKGSKLRKSSSAEKLPRPIVVRLLRRRKAEELLKAAKNRRCLTSVNTVDGQHMPLYINERLTKDNRQLFRQARSRAKEYRFRYCWVRGGNIFVRKADGKPAIRIFSPIDLDEKIGPAVRTEPGHEECTQN